MLEFFRRKLSHVDEVVRRLIGGTFCSQVRCKHVLWKRHDSNLDIQKLSFLMLLNCRELFIWFILQLFWGRQDNVIYLTCKQHCWGRFVNVWLFSKSRDLSSRCYIAFITQGLAVTEGYYSSCLIYVFSCCLLINCMAVYHELIDLNSLYSL